MKSRQKKSGYRRMKTTKAADVVRPLMDRAIRSKGFVQTEIVSRWSQIVGEELALVTVPVSLKFPFGERTGATLHIRCESAFAPLLQHRGARILELVNQYFGYGAAKKISVQQGPIKHLGRATEKPVRPLTAEEEKRLHDLLDGATESELKTALERLGKRVYGQTKPD